MTARGAMQPYADLGDRSPRWAGIRSEFAHVEGIRVHLLRVDAAAVAPPDAPTHLLLHGIGSTAVAWLDVMGPLTRLGPVVAVDLPGAGRTVPPDHRAARPEAHARLLGPLVRALGLERTVVHGWSMGGLVAVRFARREPQHVGRLVLANPGLPGPLGTFAILGWQTVGRLVLSAGAPVARWLLRFLVRRMAAKGTLPTSRPELIGGDLSRMSPEIAALLSEERVWVMSQPWRIDGYVTQWAATTSAMYVRRRPAADAVDHVTAPVLVLWGDDDPLVGRAVIDRVVARRPEWKLHVFPSVGHAPPLEVPDAYVDAVTRWSGDPVPAGGEGA
jgi:pimeloyl-ACP methyl ester carboxylesterase